MLGILEYVIIRFMQQNQFFSFVLASSSPRRKALLRQIGLKFQVLSHRFPEAQHKGRNIELVVRKAALKKAKSASKLVPKDKLIIAADTVVVLKNKILGKPRSKKEAFKMLKILSGRVHKVITGLALGYNGKFMAEVEVTRVIFKKLTKSEIIDYISTGEPLDKAGAYGIQGRASVFVKRVSGCYFNVVGLPLYRLVKMFEKFKVKLKVF